MGFDFSFHLGRSLILRASLRKHIYHSGSIFSGASLLLLLILALGFEQI